MTSTETEATEPAAEVVEPTAPTGPQLLPDEVAAEPFYFHRSVLRQLNSCGPYIRRHRELFPPTEYPEGPPINSVTCRQHADAFEWGWAVANMLEWRGRDEVERVANSRAERYKALGPGRAGNQARYAAAFGYVFATQPSMRSHHVVSAAEHVVQHMDQLARDDLNDVQQELQQANSQLEHWAEVKRRAEAQLPGLQEAVELVRVRAAERLAAQKERGVEHARRALARLEREAKKARDRATALAATGAEPAAEPATEPTTEETS